MVVLDFVGKADEGAPPSLTPPVSPKAQPTAGAPAAQSAQGPAGPSSSPREGLAGLASDLNAMSLSIGEEIASEIRASLPPGLAVDVQIEFRPGSLEWIGVVTILDWMARLSGAGSFLEFVTRAVRFAINRVMGRHIQGAAVIRTITTEIKPVTVAPEPRAAEPLRPAERWALSLLGLDTLLLAAVLAILLRGVAA
jgi:hypothetical protein